MRYSAIAERGAEGFGAYVPDLPGCVAAGESKEEVLSSIPGRPSSSGEYVEVGAA